MEKRELRIVIRDLKREYSAGEKKELSVRVMEQAGEDPAFLKASIVLAYWSMEDEVDTHDFICRWCGEKTFLLPCVKGDVLEIRYFEGVDRLKPGVAFGIGEPVGDLFTDIDKIDVILVPGVAFDRKGNRLGRGRGYYDRLLRECRAYKIGVCFPFQFVEDVPVDDLDVPMDRVIR